MLTALTHSALMVATMAHLQPTVGVSMGQKGLLFWVHRFTCKQSVPSGWQAQWRKSRHRYKVRTRGTKVGRTGGPDRTPPAPPCIAPPVQSLTGCAHGQAAHYLHRLQRMILVRARRGSAVSGV